MATEITAGGTAYDLVEGTEVTLEFEEFKVTATAGCNTILGTFRVDESTLSYAGSGTTEMGCDPALHAQDTRLLEFLESQPEVAVGADDDTVVLTSGETEMTLVDPTP